MQALQLCSAPQRGHSHLARQHSAASSRRATLGHFPATAALHRLSRRLLHAPNATESTGPQEPAPQDEEFEGLTPEEDWVVPGTYEDAMKAGTKLGKAVGSACDELAALGSLETEVLTEAQQLLQRVGFKGSLFTAPQSSEPPAETGTTA